MDRCSQTCAKCGSRNVSGPHYERTTDRLGYRCAQCGYSWTGPCRDAKHKSATMPTVWWPGRGNA